MGLCYERLGQTKKAIGAFQQAWNTLLEQRDRDLKRDAESKGIVGVDDKEAHRDVIGVILRQARAAVGIKISDRLGNEEEGARDSKEEPAVTAEPPSNTAEGLSTPAERENRRASPFDRQELTPP